MISVRASSEPFLHLLLPLIVIPKCLDKLEYLFRKLHLRKTQVGVIRHALRLSHIHRDPIPLGLVALFVVLLLELAAPFHEVIVEVLAVSEALHGHLLVLGGRGAVIGVGRRGKGGVVVREEVVVGRDVCVVGGKGHVHAVSFLVHRVEFVVVRVGGGGSFRRDAEADLQ